MANGKVLWQGKAPAPGSAVADTLFSAMEDQRKKDTQLETYREKAVIDNMARQAESSARHKFDVELEGIKSRNAIEHLREASAIAMGAETERGKQLGDLLQSSATDQMSQGRTTSFIEETPLEAGAMGPGSPRAKAIPPLAAGHAASMYGKEIDRLFGMANPDDIAAAHAQADELERAYGGKHPMGALLRNIAVGGAGKADLQGAMKDVTREMVRLSEKAAGFEVLAKARVDAAKEASRSRESVARLMINNKATSAERKSIENTLIAKMKDATNQMRSLRDMASMDPTSAKKAYAEIGMWQQIHDEMSADLSKLQSKAVDEMTQPAPPSTVITKQRALGHEVLRKTFPKETSGLQTPEQMNAFFQSMTRTQRKKFDEAMEAASSANRFMGPQAPPRMSGGVKG